MEDDEIVAEYTVRFNKVLKRVDYNGNFTQKIKVRKFINDLTNKLVELAQVQNLTNLDDVIIAIILAEIGIK